jgi:hypothetical protein
VSKLPLALIASGLLGGLLLLGGGKVSPGPSDAVSAVFDAQESKFRQLSGERAKALRSGEITSEAASVAWMQSRWLPAFESEWSKLLTREAEEFGGEQWTAEKEAAWIERYAR